jgi:hypothetical protein
MQNPLTEKEIEVLLKVCELTVTQAFKEKIKGDEYFKRGFLLACQELRAVITNVLSQYQVIRNENKS